MFFQDKIWSLELGRNMHSELGFKLGQQYIVHYLCLVSCSVAYVYVCVYVYISPKSGSDLFHRRGSFASFFRWRVIINWHIGNIFCRLENWDMLLNTLLIRILFSTDNKRVKNPFKMTKVWTLKEASSCT